MVSTPITDLGYFETGVYTFLHLVADIDFLDGHYHSPSAPQFYFHHYNSYWSGGVIGYNVSSEDQEPVPMMALDYWVAELNIDQQNHPARGANVSMDLSDASNELLSETCTGLVRLQDHLVTLESEADVDENTDPVVGDISKLITQVKDEVQERGLNEQELRNQARQ